MDCGGLRPPPLRGPAKRLEKRRESFALAGLPPRHGPRNPRCAPLFPRPFAAPNVLDTRLSGSEECLRNRPPLQGGGRKGADEKQAAGIGSVGYSALSDFWRGRTSALSDIVVAAWTNFNCSACFASLGLLMVYIWLILQEGEPIYHGANIQWPGKPSPMTAIDS